MSKALVGARSLLHFDTGPLRRPTDPELLGAQMLVTFSGTGGDFAHDGAHTEARAPILPERSSDRTADPDPPEIPFTALFSSPPRDDSARVAWVLLRSHADSDPHDMICAKSHPQPDQMR